MMKAYTAGKIFTGTGWLSDKAVIVVNDRVHDIVPLSGAGPIVQSFGPDSILAPAFIDVQIYGANKKLLAVHPTEEALSDLASHCMEGGTVLFQPTLATNSIEIFYKCIDSVRAYRAKGGKGVWGLHLEGPWINPVKRGAHVASFIHAPGIDEVRDLLEYGKGIITMITLAPEVCSDEVIRMIRSYNIVVSAGHSNCSFEQANKGFANGITAVTHLYNAMSPLQHREPGLVGACFMHDSVKASIIADGHHVRFEAIAIAKQLMGERLFAITDAVTETNEGPYPHQLEGDKYTSGGTLSGSAISMHRTMQNLVQQAGIPVEEALRMCSLYPAQVLGCDDSNGKIAPGAMAQFVVLTKQLALVDVIT